MAEANDDERQTGAGLSLLGALLTHGRRIARSRGGDRKIHPWLPLAVVAAIPLITAGFTEVIAIGERHRIIQLEQQYAGQLAQLAAIEHVDAIKHQVAPLLTHRTITDVLGRLVQILPADAQIRMLEAKADGSIAAAIEAGDPDAVRAALRTDPLLRSLQMVGQAPADTGVRAMFSSTAR